MRARPDEVWYSLTIILFRERSNLQKTKVVGGGTGAGFTLIGGNQRVLLGQHP